MLYSKTTGGFYDAAIHGAAIPEDAIEITADEYAQLLAGQSNGMSIACDEGGRPRLVAPPKSSLASLTAAIDAAADAARQTVAGDPLRAVEYEKAAAEAQAFKAAGYPDEAVPRTVAAWAINGRTPQQAAESILAEAAAYTEAFYCIREIRLLGKEQIRAQLAAGSTEQAEQTANEAVAAIGAVIAGVGNAQATS